MSECEYNYECLNCDWVTAEIKKLKITECPKCDGTIVCNVYTWTGSSKGDPDEGANYWNCNRREVCDEEV